MCEAGNYPYGHPYGPTMPDTEMDAECIIYDLADLYYDVQIGRHQPGVRGYYASIEYVGPTGDGSLELVKSWDKTGHGYTIREALINALEILHGGKARPNTEFYTERWLMSEGYGSRYDAKQERIEERRRVNAEKLFVDPATATAEQMVEGLRACESFKYFSGPSVAVPVPLFNRIIQLLSDPRLKLKYGVTTEEQLYVTCLHKRTAERIVSYLDEFEFRQHRITNF